VGEAIVHHSSEWKPFSCHLVMREELQSRMVPPRTLADVPTSATATAP